MSGQGSENQDSVLLPKVHWSRAIGYLKLEMLEQAENELNFLPDEMPWSKNRRSMLVEIFQLRKDWLEMKKIAHSLRMEFPTDVEWWVADAYATRRCDNIEKAREILLDGLVHHYENAMIRFNLACYACKLGSHGECLDFLKEAVKRDERYKQMAMEDDDLEDVREALRNLGWGQALA